MANGKIIFKNNEIYRLNELDEPIWDTPFKLDVRPDKTFISQVRLLLTTFTKHWHSWGFMGPALLIDLTSGKLIEQLKGNTGAPLSNGQFILGLEGYDDFNTWLYDKDGELVTEWRSYGHYIIDKNDDIRVVEKDRRQPTQSKVVKLKRNGQIEKGPLLYDAQVAAPLDLDNQSIIIFDLGNIQLIDKNLVEQFNQPLVKMNHQESHRFNSSMEFKGNLVILDLYVKSKTTPNKTIKHSWEIEVSL